MPTKLMEEQLEEDKRRTVLPLKNGGQIETRRGRVYYADFVLLQEKEPELFRALLAIAQDRPGEVVPEHRATLKRMGGFLERDGSIKPLVRDVLLSAYRETPEGPVLVNPFILRSQEQTQDLERIETENLDRVIRELREGKDKGRPPGRG